MVRKKYISEMTLAESDDGSPDRRGGVFLPWAAVIIYVMTSLALAAGVGLIVHFAHPGGSCEDVVTTPAPSTTPPVFTTPSEDLIWETCVNISIARNECLPVPPCSTTPPPLTTTVTPVPTPNMRLPRTLLPYHYNIELKPDIYQANSDLFNFSGKVDIFLECVESTNVITVHTRKMDVNEPSVVVREVDGVEIDKTSTAYDPVTEFYTVTLSRNVAIGDMVVLSMDYSGPLNKDMTGIYWSQYKEGDDTKYMVASQLQSTDARKAFPCLDEPNLKATFNVTLLRKEPMIALSNMPNYTSEDRGDGWFAERFEKTSVVMPTYLLAFAVADFKFIEDTATGGLSSKYTRYWARPAAIEAGHADYARSIGSPMFNWFEEHFNIPFDLEKLDSISVPDFSAGAMENWGLVTYRETRLLFDPEYMTTYQKQRFSGTIGHELLHMWIGNLVTCDWWDDTWLNEGYARFYQHFSLQYAQPLWNMNHLLLAQTFFRALAGDSSGRSHPLTNPVNTPAEVRSMFSSITYDKGACIIRMVMNFMGNETFFNGMRAYVQKMKYQNAKHDDLLSTMDEQANWEGLDLEVSVTQVWYTWIKQMGYPVVTLTRTSQSTVDVTQSMFLLNDLSPIKESYPSQYDYSWHIPLTYTTSSSPDWTPDNIKEWLYRQNKTINLGESLGTDDWIIANVGQMGFYRVNYDSENWEALIKQLNTDHGLIETINRAQIIEDTLNFGRSGLLDQTWSLKTTEYLVKEIEYLPFYALENNLPFIDRMLSKLSGYGDFRKYIRDLVSGAYHRLGWDEQENESILDTYLRILALWHACYFGQEDCIDESVRRFQLWRDDEDNMTIIRPDIREIVYCYGIQYGSDDDWDFLFSRYQQETDVTEKTVLHDSLSCTSQVWVLSRFFLLAADANSTEIDSEDRTYTLVSVAANPNGRGIAWKYLNTMWDTLPGRISVLFKFADYFATEIELQQLEDFISDHADDIAADDKDSLLYTVKSNIRWQQRNKDSVLEWLTDKVQTNTNQLS